MHTHLQMQVLWEHYENTQILTAVSFFLSFTHTHTLYINFCSKCPVNFNRESVHSGDGKSPLRSTLLTQTNNIQMYSCTLRQNTCSKCPFYKSSLCLRGGWETFMTDSNSLHIKQFSDCIKIAHCSCCWSCLARFNSKQHGAEKWNIQNPLLFWSVCHSSY